MTDYYCLCGKVALPAWGLCRSCIEEMVGDDMLWQEAEASAALAEPKQVEINLPRHEVEQG